MKKAKNALLQISNWTRKKHLCLTLHKMEAVILKGKRSMQNICFTLEEDTTKPARYVKYLGIWLGDQIFFAEHIRRTINTIQYDHQGK